MMLLPLVTIGIWVGYCEGHVNATIGFGDREFSLTEAGTILLSILILLMAVILFVTYRINKRIYRNDNNIKENVAERLATYKAK